MNCRAVGGRERATAPGKQGWGHSKSEITKLKCCNYMIFPYVKLLTQAARIQFFETYFLFLRIQGQTPVILTFLFNNRDLYSSCTVHIQSN